MNNKYIFISYKSDEKDFAIDVKLALAENGIKAWVDQEEIMAGDNYAECIDEAVRESSAILIILSEKSMSSAHVKSELSLGLMYSKPIYAYVIEDCEANEEFDFDLPPEKRYEAFKDKQQATENMISYLRAQIESDDKDPYDVSDFLKKRHRHIKEMREKRREEWQERIRKSREERNAEKKPIKLYKRFPFNLTPYARNFSLDRYTRFALNLHTILFVIALLVSGVAIAFQRHPLAFIYGVGYVFVTFVLGEAIIGLLSYLLGKTKNYVIICMLSVFTLYLLFFVVLISIAITVTGLMR